MAWCPRCDASTVSPSQLRSKAPRASCVACVCDIVWIAATDRDEDNAARFVTNGLQRDALALAFARERARGLEEAARMADAEETLMGKAYAEAIRARRGAP